VKPRWCSSRNGHAGRYSGNRRVTAGEGDEGTASGGRPTQRDAARGGDPPLTLVGFSVSEVRLDRMEAAA